MGKACRTFDVEDLEPVKKWRVTLYAVTANHTYTPGDRKVVRRMESNRLSYAIYETPEEAKRAITGFKGHRRELENFQIEEVKLTGVVVG